MHCLRFENSFYKHTSVASVESFFLTSVTVARRKFYGTTATAIQAQACAVESEKDIQRRQRTRTGMNGSE